MKKIHHLLILILIISNYSCQKDDISIPEIENQQVTEKNRTNTPEISEAEALEINMQWVSYMTAQILIKNANGTQKFIEEYTAELTENGHSIIQLSNLLADYEEDLSFRNAFENEFNIFSDETENPCEGQGRPEGRLKPPTPCQPIPCITQEDKFNALIDYLIVENCLELYVSNFSDTSRKIISTAHPMVTNTNSNTAFKHTSECSVDEILFNLISFFEPSTSYIITRPFRNEMNCEYNQFMEITNFSTFPN